MSLLERGPGLLVLVDPSRTAAEEAARVAREARAAGAAGLLIGSSFDGTRDTQLVARAIRQAVPGFPVALFPGSAMQLTDEVDLVLFLSLVSGRNAQYLIEEHVRAVPFLTRHPVPPEGIRVGRDAVGELPLFVGGGIRRPEQAQEARAAGADFVVIGTAIEAADADLAAFVRAVGDPGTRR